MTMTRKDFKIIADNLKNLVIDLKANYENFDKDKFKKHIFYPKTTKPDIYNSIKRNKLTQYQEGIDKHDYIDKENI